MKNIEIIDANIILRYLLNDHEGFSKKSVKIIEQMDIFLPFEVGAEVVYVLEKIYNVPRKDITNSLTILIDYPNITTSDRNVLKKALSIYSVKKVDFVDSILIAYNHISGIKIHSFDKSVNKLCM
jgi:predicted nucleic-acid-binding protein